MIQTLVWILVGISVLLSIIIMLQAKGTGLSLAPGSGDFGKFERRGPEKVLHIITIILVIAFIAISLVHFFFAP